MSDSPGQSGWGENETSWGASLIPQSFYTRNVTARPTRPPGSSCGFQDDVGHSMGHRVCFM